MHLQDNAGGKWYFPLILASKHSKYSYSAQYYWEMY